jgi:tetratricopeptide (TPR) repeat protein
MMKRMLNGRLALRLLGCLAGLTVGVHLLHGWQVGRQARVLREQVLQAEEQGQAEHAAARLRRYLAFAPEDTDALAHYGELQERLAQTPAQRGRAAGVYAQVLGRQPERADVRRRLAVLALELGRTDQARKLLEDLLAAQPGQADLEGLLGLCLELAGQSRAAADAYRQALDHDPKQRDVAVHLARLLHGPLGDPRKAARVLDDMIRAHDGSAEAYLARARFRMDNGALKDAEADLARARDRAPNDLRVLLAAADLAGRRGRNDEARQFLRQARTHAPADAGTHLALASLEARAGRTRAAADCLREGLETIPDDTDLLTALAEVHIDAGEQPAAEEIISRMRAAPAQALRADYLEGLLRLRRGEWARGAGALEKVVQQGEEAPALAARAAVALGDCRMHLGDGDRRLTALRQAVALDPALGSARLALGAALQAAGRAEEGLEQYRQAALLPQPPDETWVLLARALVQRNQTLPARARNWAEVEKVLDRAAGRPAVGAAAAVVRAEMLQAQGLADQARPVLEAARDAQPDRVEPWVALAALAAHQGDARGAAGVLAAARARLGDRRELRATELDLVPPDRGDSFTALKEVEKNSVAGTPEEKDRFLCRVAAAWFEAGEFAEGERLCRQLAARPAADLATRVALLEVVLHGGVDRLAEGLVADVRRLEGEDGTWWRYGEAARQLQRAQRGDRAGLEGVARLLDEAARRRPEWSRVPLARAHLAELAGDPAQAVDHYRRAFDLGERQPAMLQRLVRLLTEEGRDADADQVLCRVQQQEVLSGSLARLAAEVALRLHKRERAAEMARRAVPPTSRDYRDQVWLGQVLGLAGWADEAEAALGRAVQLAGGLPDPWAALVAHLARAGKVGEAEEGMKAMEKRMPPDQAELALAVCHEALAHTAEADRHYRAALKQRPDDGLVLQRVASFCVRLDRPGEAVPLLRRLMDPAVAVPDGNRRWARRQLALALAFDGDEAKYGEAQDLLRTDGDDDPAARRARDFLAAARPQTRADALRRLEASLKAVPSAADELFRLACVYEADNDWDRARQTMLDVLALDANNPEYLAHFTVSLLRRGKKDEARPWVVRLEKLEPGSPRVTKFREALGPVRVGTGPTKGAGPAQGKK